MQAPTIHLLDYWAVVVRRRSLIGLLVLCCGLVALIGSYVATPRYRATATLQLERESPDILTFRDVARTDYAWTAYEDFYQTQYKILASDAVARAAAQRLDLDTHPAFAPQESSPGLLARLRRLLPRKGAVRPLEPLEASAARVRAGLSVTPVRDSQLVDVAWSGEDPELAARIANAVVDAYIQFNIQSSFTTSDQAREFLIKQIEQLKSEIGTYDAQLQAYGETKQIVSIDDTNNITLKALADLAQRRTQAQSMTAEKLAAWQAVRESEPSDLQEVADSPLITRLKQEQASMLADWSEQSKRFKDDWPGMRALRSKIEQTERRIADETTAIAAQVVAAARTEHRRAEAELARLDQLVGEQEQAAQRLKRDAIEFTSLQSEVDKKRETLDALLTRQNEMALSSRLKDLDVTSSNIRVVDRAKVPLAPAWPNTKLNLLLGLFVGLVAGVGLALLLEQLDNTVGTPAQLQALTDLPLLATVPRGGNRGRSLVKRSLPAAVESVDLIAQRDGKSPTSEAFRGLRTSLMLSSPGEAPRRILVTSPSPQEGKSVAAINLAIVFAQLGRRVLLVDADLRRPRLHKAFERDAGRGLTTYLSGIEADVSRLIQPTVVEGLDLLTAGPIPPNPAELLDSERFKQLAPALLEGDYDHVLFDSPPALSVADPIIMADAVDALVLVTRAERTSRQSLTLTLDRFRDSGVQPTGIVLTDVAVGGHGYGSYYYSYGDASDDAAPEDSGSRSRSRGNG